MKIVLSRTTRLVGLVASLVPALVCADASAQRASLNLGRGFQPRFFNSTEYDSEAGRTVGQTKLVLRTYIDMAPGPVAVAVEQGGRPLMQATCDAAPRTLAGGETQVGLWECETPPVNASTIRADQPVDIVLRNPAAGSAEIYRGTYPVVAFRQYVGQSGGRAEHAEQRALRLDSLYGAVFMQQIGDRVELTYVTTTPDERPVDDLAVRCRVGTGAWTPYGASERETGNTQVAQDRNGDGDGIEENEIVTSFHSIAVRMPIAVPGRAARPTAGTRLDGAWTCELVADGTVARTAQFTVQNGFVQPSAIDGQLPAGRGAALASVTFNPQALPAIFDPAIVRSTLVGRSVAAPVTGGMPTRATHPPFSAPARAAAPAASARARRSR